MRTLRERLPLGRQPMGMVNILLTPKLAREINDELTVKLDQYDTRTRPTRGDTDE